MARRADLSCGETGTLVKSRQPAVAFVGNKAMRRNAAGLIGVTIVAIAFGLVLPFGPVLAASQSSSGTIAAIVAGGGSWTCNVSHAAANEKTQGTIFVGGGKMRGDFTSQTSRGPIQSHMISDGTSMYVWSSARPQGIKMAVPAAGKAPPQGNSQGSLYNKTVNYACSPWTVDEAEFALPQDVSFIDASAMMGGTKMPGAMGAPGMGAGAPNMCAMCDQAPQGPARDRCRAAMHCQ
jgi:hypothetical protein